MKRNDNSTIERVDTIRPRQPQPERLTRGEAVFIACMVTSMLGYLSAVAYGVTATNRDQVAYERDTASMNRALTKEAQADGFAGFTINRYGWSSTDTPPKVARGLLQITQNCAIDGVAVTYDGTAPNPTDATSYSFTSYAPGEAYTTEEQTGHVRRQVPGVRGAEVTFTFTDAVDLRSNVLGSMPCAALAQNIGIVNQASGVS